MAIWFNGVIGIDQNHQVNAAVARLHRFVRRRELVGLVFSNSEMKMRRIKYIIGAVALIFTSNAHAYDAQRIRDVLAGALGGSLCTGPASAWCAALSMEAAYWVDQGVALVIDRKFKADDQAFANKTGLTICYSDGTCISPKK